MNIVRYWVLAFAAFCALSQPVRAQANPDAPVISKTWHALYEVTADGRSTESYTSRLQVVHESALERAKMFSFSFSTSIQSGEVLEAYTLKKDGRKITVPANNYQTEVNDGRTGAQPMFSDWTRISVVYPELSVGDTVGISYRITNKEPMFPGHFSLAQSFSIYNVYEDAQITIRVPKDLKLGVQVYGLQAVDSADSGETRTLQWRYQNLKPSQWSEEDAGIWRLDEWPGLLVSTFPSYEAIAKAYGDRALPKAEPTARIRELAKQIISDETKPRVRARLLYEWVSKNITYGGNCIGVGAVVPRDLDVVLDNKMGDCKDHATLLQSLLSAAGIRSEQVLINAGSLYELPGTPVVSLVNHVMNFLPDFQLYVDSTAKEIPFGYLPSSSYAKPVIHVGAVKALAMTPNQEHEKTEQRLRMKLKMTDRGGATGELRVEIKGVQAAQVRAYMRNLTGEMERNFAKMALSSYGYKGRGTIDKGDTSGLSDQYGFGLNFEIDNYLDGGTTGAFMLAPVMSTPLPVMNFADIKGRTEPNRRHTCHGFHSYETFDIELAPGLTLVSLPPNAKMRSRLIDYTAKYQKTKLGLLVAREVHDKTSDSVCTAQAAAELHEQALLVAENLKTQVLYRRKAR